MPPAAPAPAPAPPALHPLCETAARALGCAARIVLHDAEGRECWRVDADPHGGRWSAADDGAAVRVPLGGEGGARGTLCLAAPDGGASWGDAEHALAASFARLAAAALADAGAARRSEEHFRRMIEHAHDLIVIMDETGVTRYGSPSVRRILGYDPEVYRDTSLVTFFHPDDAPRVVEWLGGLAARPGETHRIEFHFRHADGHWVDLEAVSATSADHRPGTGHVINVRDVTERRRAEAALRESEARYRSLIEQLPAIIYTASLEEGNPTIFASPQAERLLGFGEAEWRASPRLWLERVHDDDRARVEAEWDAAHREGRRFAAEYRMVARDGRVLWFRDEAALLRDAQGRPLYIQGVMLDVTERRAAEDALRASEEQFRTLIEHAHDAIVIIDDHGRPVYGSPSVRRVLGVDPAEVDGGAREAPYHPDDVPRIAAWLRQLGEQPGATHRIEYRFRHGAGHWVDLEAVSAVPAGYQPGTGHVVSIRDVTERRRAEAELRRSEEHFRTLTENSHDIIVIIDGHTGQIAYQTPSMQRILGYAPEDLAGRSAFELVHPDDLAHVIPEIAAAVAQPGTTRHAEYRYRHRDGSWRHLETFGRTLSPTSAEDGLVFNTRDVTERRASELALQRSEEHFRRLIEHSYDLVQVLDAEGHIVYTGPSVQRLLGYTPAEIAGMTIPDFMHPDDLPAAGALVAHVLANPGLSGSLEYRVRHKDGSWRWLEAYARTLSPTSAEDGLVANARDVTDRKASELALQQSEEHFRRLIENGSDLLMISAVDGALQYVSPSAERLLGYPPSEMLGKVPADLVHPDDLAVVGATMRMLAERPGTVGEVTWRIRHRDGSWRVVAAMGRTLSPDSAEAGIVINGRDVTERQAADAALRQAKADAEQAREEAERANRAKSEFLSRMSHELRTPLNSILGFAQVLEDLELPPAYRGGVRHILNGGRHLLNLINEVLDIARIEADEQPMSIEPVRVEAVIREAMDIVRPLADARGIRVAELPHPAMWRHVRADRQRLTQVLLNLLSNAVKYNRPAGAVRIGCEPVADASGREWLRIRVHDQGPGIAAERQGELFVPFARLGAEHSGVEGTGLGLALSQRLAHAMGGTLLLERSDAGGSVFAVDLEPAADPLAALPAAAALRERGAAELRGAATLLYVEDNLANLSLVETILLPHPEWRVLPALQGRMGLELAARHAPDLILLDLHLPDMHGRDVLRQLRADARTAHIPVVVISADATPRTVDTLVAEGVEAFLTKPLDVRAFLATVERVLARRPDAR